MGETCPSDVYLPVSQWVDSQGVIAQTVGTPCSQGMTSSFETSTLRMCLPSGVDAKLNNIPKNLMDQVDNAPCVKQAKQDQQDRNQAVIQANADKTRQMSEQAQKTADVGGRDVGAYTKADYTEVAAPLREVGIGKDMGTYMKPKIAVVPNIDEKDYFSKQKAFKQAQMGISYEV